MNTFLGTLWGKVVAIVVAACVMLFGFVAYNVNQAKMLNQAYANGIASQKAVDAQSVIALNAAHNEDIKKLEDQIAANQAASRARILTADRAQQAATAALEARLRQMPDGEVGARTATLLDESRKRWPQ